MAVWDQLDSSAYNNIVTFSSDMFAVATSTPDTNGDGNTTLTPQNGVNWTQDTTVPVGGSGQQEQVYATVVDDTAGVLMFQIIQPDGTSSTIYGQVIGYNGIIIGFQAFQNWDPTDGPNGSVPGVPFFYISDTPLGAGAAPVDGTGLSLNNTEVPVFLDPDVPAVTRPLLLNNASAQTTEGDQGGTAYASLVGLNLSSDNVSVIGDLSQDPTTLTVTAVASPLTNTFTTLFGGQTVSVIAAYNDAQVIELQYTSGGSTVDVFGQLIGWYSDATPGDGALLFQTYSGFDPATGALTQSAADESMPYILLSEQSLAATAGMPATGAGGDENSFSQTAFPLSLTGHTPLPFGLGVEPLNLTDTFAGHVFTSNQFLSTNAGSDGSSGYNLTRTTDHHDWTNSFNATVGGAGAVETVTVAAVNDTYQVVQFDITGGPNGPQTIYGKLLGWNATEVGFQAFSSFDPTSGALSGAITGVPNFALTEVPTTFTGSGLNLSPDVTPLNLAELPLFPDPNTPATALDLVPLDGMALSSDDVSTLAEVQQNPTTGNYSILADGLNQTFTDNALFGAGTSSVGQIAVSQVFDDNGNSTTDQFQVVEVTWTGSTTTAYDVDARVIGYNSDSLLLQVLGNATSGSFNTTTGVWAPANSTEAPPGPFLVISDASLEATNGLPVNDTFTTSGLNTPFLLGEVCFCTGTLITTPTGETEVERLAVGDMVLTHHGKARRIVWIGRGQVMVTRGRRSPATPVIVRKGALAPNVPHHDLHVTKGHSFYLDGVLIPAEFLVNHRSIVWDDMAQEVSIYHVELETHDLLLANGAPAESYRDDGNRWLFQNGNSGWDLPPKPPCAPVLTGGPIVDAAWRRLLDRAGPRRGMPMTDQPDLHVLVDGRRVNASSPSSSVRLFALPTMCQSIRLVSRSAVPLELGLTRDARELGVAIRRIVLRRGAWFRTLDASDPALTEGFHAFEPSEGIRWTNGDAAVPTALFDGAVGPLELVVVLGGATQYVDDGFTMRRVA